jgi:hypothetical protein
MDRKFRRRAARAGRATMVFGTAAALVLAAGTFNAIVDAYCAQPDPIRRLEGGFQAAFALPWPASRAWVSWGWTNPVIAATQSRVYRRVEEVHAAIYAELIGDAETAVLVAKMAMGVAIGMQTRYPPTDLEEYATIGLEWARRCLDLEAELVHVNGMLQVRLARRAPPGEDTAAPLSCDAGRQPAERTSRTKARVR